MKSVTLLVASYFIRLVLIVLVCGVAAMGPIMLIDPQESWFPPAAHITLYTLIVVGVIWVLIGSAQGSLARHERTKHRNEVRRARKNTAFLSYRGSDRALAEKAREALSSFGWRTRMWDPHAPLEKRVTKATVFDWLHESSIVLVISPTEKSPWMEFEGELARRLRHRIITIRSDRDLAHLPAALKELPEDEPDVWYTYEQREGVEPRYDHYRIPGPLAMTLHEYDPVSNIGYFHWFLGAVWELLLIAALILNCGIVALVFGWLLGSIVMWIIVILALVIGMEDRRSA